MPPRDPPRNPRRRRLLEAIRLRPGATFRELVRETGLAAGTARHHLTMLRRSGRIEEHRHHSTLRYFEAGRFDDWEAVVLLREPDLAMLHAWVREHPGSIQRDVLVAARSWGWSRSTTQHRLQRLVAGGLLEVVPAGRRKAYRAARREASGTVTVLQRMQAAVAAGA